MASTLELNLLEHQSAQRSTDRAIVEHSQDITKNEKALQTAKNQLKIINDSMHASEERKNVLNTQIKKIEEVLNAKGKDHSHATAQRQQHADNIKFTQKALLDVKKQAPARRQLKPPLQIPADFLQASKELQTDAHMHNYLVNKHKYTPGEGKGIHHAPDGKTHKLTKKNGRYQIEEQR